jgi:aldehyde dehydrogenase (NAD+)
LLINGKWVNASDGKTFDTIDPSNGNLLTKVASAGAKDVDLAVKAA